MKSRMTIAAVLLTAITLANAQPVAVIINEPIPSGKGTKTDHEALIAIKSSQTSSNAMVYVGMGGIERPGLSTITGDGALISNDGGGLEAGPSWHIESGFAAITTDLTNFPTWTTDRTQAGGEALIGSESSGGGVSRMPDITALSDTTPIQGTYYSLVEVRKSGVSMRDRVFCFKGRIELKAANGSETMTLEPGQYAVALKKGTVTAFDGPYSFVSSPPADVVEFLDQVGPKLEKLNMPLPTVGP